MTCSTCRFYKQEADENWGRCHRFPPQRAAYVTGRGGDYRDMEIDTEANFAFPTVDDKDWCGEHQPNIPASA